MGFTGASSIVIALAVGLWLCYAVPTWLRRQNELAVERNALRLQQTIRVLAESSETPEQPSVRRSNSRFASVERPRLKRHHDAVAPVEFDADARAAKQLRRGRLLSTAVLALGLIGAGIGGWIATSVSNWWVLAISLLAIAGAIMMLQRLQHVAERRRARHAQQAATSAVVAERRAHALPEEVLSFDAVTEQPAVAEPEKALVGWTPTPLPKPLYLSRDLGDGPDGGPDGDGPRVERDHMAELMAAVRRSEEAIREAHRGAGVATFGAMEAITVPDDRPLVREPQGAEAASATLRAVDAAPEAAPSRWASMGVLGEIEPEFDDLSQVLRRRRAS